LKTILRRALLLLQLLFPLLFQAALALVVLFLTELSRASLLLCDHLLLAVFGEALALLAILVLLLRLELGVPCYDPAVAALDGSDPAAVCSAAPLSVVALSSLCLRPAASDPAAFRFGVFQILLGRLVFVRLVLFFVLLILLWVSKSSGSRSTNRATVLRTAIRFIECSLELRLNSAAQSNCAFLTSWKAFYCRLQLRRATRERA
jgi:hypothetical protein